MARFDAISTRMKENYEFPYRFKMSRRTPVIIRLDGKAFHNFTKGFVRPFDHVLMTAMQKTMLDLCRNIQGTVLGYTQSDEISLLLIDYQNLDSCAWFDNEVQKICSVSASMCTLYFNKHFSEEVAKSADGSAEHKARLKAAETGGMFDARCFNVPVDEVTNYFLGRQNDASRNSVQMVGQCYFCQKELQGKSGNDIQDMLLTQHDINWNNFTVPEKRGAACYKTEDGWLLDFEMPILKESGRDYVERLLVPAE